MKTLNESLKSSTEFLCYLNCEMRITFVFLFIGVWRRWIVFVDRIALLLVVIGYGISF